MPDDELPTAAEPGDVEVDRALAAWTALAPPAGFADRVLDARGPDRSGPRRASRVGRVAMIAGATAAAAAGTIAVVAWSPGRAASGTLVTTRRMTQALGDRGIAVAEPASELTWRVDRRGAADLVQRTGNVFYRVERGEPFVVHTPAGDVRVTGTCFRIEVESMNTNQKMWLAGVAGAAVASAVLVTVYEGHVVAQTRSARTELSAGSSAALGPDGATLVAGGGLATASDDAHASREQLLVRTQQQQAQLVALRARLAALENTAAPVRNAAAVENGVPGVPDDEVPEPGRLWHDPSPERLAGWAKTCHVRSDQPDIDHWQPVTAPDGRRGIEAPELATYNEVMGGMVKRSRDLVQGLYLETTGDAAGADTLSIDAMRREVEDKSPPGEGQRVRQRIAQERAGLAAPPTDPSKASALERMLRLFAQQGDQIEAALAARLGPERAHAIRGEGWDARSDWSGCPAPPDGR